jgi:tellurite methyltransferase
VQRAINGYHLDEEGDWVAELSCGHVQHVRHRPPFQPREWVLDVEGRTARIGAPLNCPLCDRAELPDGLQLVRTSTRWDEHTMPVGLERAHRIAAGTWGRIVVHNGHLRFAARTQPEIDIVLNSGSVQAIPPEVEHEVQALGEVSFSVDFLSVPDARTRTTAPLLAFDDQGGETACWAHLLCQECGAVLEGGSHMDSCSHND